MPPDGHDPEGCPNGLGGLSALLTQAGAFFGVVSGMVSRTGGGEGRPGSGGGLLPVGLDWGSLPRGAWMRVGCRGEERRR
jgi:hypothetical protein